MGQNQSKASSPLSLLLSHFKEVQARGHNLSLDIRKSKLVILCRSEWPTFNVRWPPEGTFSLPIITKVRHQILLPGEKGHPDQAPYIFLWQDLIENPPPWVSFFLPLPPHKVLAAQTPGPTKPIAPILPDSQDTLLLDPPPYLPQPMAPMPDPHPQAEPGASRTRGQTRRGTDPYSPDSTVALPLREIGPPDDTGNPRLQYWPFSTSDLYNWKTQNACFSDNPKDLIALLESIMFTHQPTWDDCQQLLGILFTTEERERVLLESRKLVLGNDGRPTINPDLINAAFPLARPEWDYNTAEGRGRLLTYRQTLMAGLRAAARKPTNLAKVYSVIQGRTESPATFLERLMEAFRQYTPMNPEAPENQAAVVMAFVNQAAPDIKRKLQKLEDFEGKQIQDFVRIAQRVYNNRDAPEEKQLKATREMTKVLTSVIQGDQRLPLAKDQCAYCKERGHWKKNCPKKGPAYKKAGSQSSKPHTWHVKETSGETPILFAQDDD
uniref:CCHC-type domain-containing protein n=1 Tax=Suricata suricatta TaxID=37032 RepID=A0A673T755_SURSU